MKRIILFIICFLTFTLSYSQVEYTYEGGDIINFGGGVASIQERIYLMSFNSQERFDIAGRPSLLGYLKYNSWSHHFNIDGANKLIIDESALTISDDQIVTRDHSGIHSDLIAFAYGDIRFEANFADLFKSSGNFSISTGIAGVSAYVKIIFSTSLVDVRNLTVMASAADIFHDIAVDVNTTENCVILNISDIRQLASGSGIVPSEFDIDFVALKVK